MPAAAIPPASTRPAGVASAAERPLRVVLADDHLVVRAGMRLLLRADPRFKVVAEAHDVPSTLAALRAFRPDVLVLDISMGGESSLPRLPEMRAIAPGTRVLVLTMQEDPAFAREALRAGARGYLLKEAAAEELLAAVAEVAAGGTYLQPALGAQLAVRDDPEVDLTDRERDVLRLLASGYTNQEIAERLYLSLRTVEAHRAHLRDKLQAETRADLVAAARRFHL